MQAAGAMAGSTACFRELAIAFREDPIWTSQVLVERFLAPLD